MRYQVLILGPAHILEARDGGVSSKWPLSTPSKSLSTNPSWSPYHHSQRYVNIAIRAALLNLQVRRVGNFDLNRNLYKWLRLASWHLWLQGIFPCTRSSYDIFICIVASLLKARTVGPGKQQLLGNGSVTCNNVITVESGVFCAVHAEAV
jgi:hypothetical protein